MTATIQFRKAKIEEIESIWKIFIKAIEKRRLEGSKQWQDGYPNIDIIREDIQHDNGYIAFLDSSEIVGYIAIINDIEPAYEEIVGDWDETTNYAVIHRLAVEPDLPIKGTGTSLMKFAEKVSVENKIFSLKADTNFDNTAMLAVFDKLGYLYRGKVYFRGGERLAYEKKLN